MLIRVLSFAFAVLFLTASCTKDPVETGRYELSQSELDLLPYKLGDTINFVHSNGYEFDFIVIDDTIKWTIKEDFCDMFFCDQEYISFQYKSVTLQSDYPFFTLQFNLAGTEWYYQPNTIFFQINNQHSVTLHYDNESNIICSNAAICHDSITINGKVYSCVIEKKFDFSSLPLDSIRLAPESILYGNVGLLQIKMNNNETYSINE